MKRRPPPQRDYSGGPCSPSPPLVKHPPHIQKHYTDQDQRAALCMCVQRERQTERERERGCVFVVTSQFIMQDDATLWHPSSFDHYVKLLSSVPPRIHHSPPSCLLRKQRTFKLLKRTNRQNVWSNPTFTRHCSRKGQKRKVGHMWSKHNTAWRNRCIQTISVLREVLIYSRHVHNTAFKKETLNFLFTVFKM